MANANLLRRWIKQYRNDSMSVSMVNQVNTLIPKLCRLRL